MIFIKNDAAIERIHQYERQLGINLNKLADANLNFLLFGGAVRDSLLDKDSCKDFDIIFLEFPGDLRNVFPNLEHCSASSLTESKFLKGNGYRYRGVKVLDAMFLKEPEKYYSPLIQLFDVVNHVDVNISGMAYHPYCGIIEVIPGASKFIQRKIFMIHTTESNYFMDRNEERIKKFEEDGWLKIN